MIVGFIFANQWLHGKPWEMAKLPNRRGKGRCTSWRYYVAFDTTYKKQLAELIDSGIHEEEAKNQVPIH